jgi:hypothetical protein
MKKLTPKMQKHIEKVQEKLFDAHIDFIEKEYGEDVSANYGWVQGEWEYCSKIYKDPREYVSSYVGKDGEFIHEITTD